ncbi:MAG: hypothetical protein R3F39_11640 [Myxococcota bacterium]
MFPRCVTREGNLRAQASLWEVFQPIGGRWRGIAHIPNGNLRLRDKWHARFDARRRFGIDLESLWHAPPRLAGLCRCGDIMAGAASPTDCGLFGKQCTPSEPVGACMVRRRAPAASGTPTAATPTWRCLVSGLPLQRPP